MIGGVTRHIWGPPPPCKQALSLTKGVARGEADNLNFACHMLIRTFLAELSRGQRSTMGKKIW